MDASAHTVARRAPRGAVVGARHLRVPRVDRREDRRNVVEALRQPHDVKMAEHREGCL